MWTLKENRNSSGSAEESFLKPNTDSFVEYGQKMDLSSPPTPLFFFCLSQKEFQD